MKPFSWIHFSWSRLLMLLASTSIVGFVVYAYWPKPVQVEVATAAEGPLRVTIDQEGEVRTHDRYMISAPVAGRVQRIEWHDGDAVAAGDALVTLWPLPLSAREREEQTARLAAAQAAVREAEQRLQQANANAAQAQRERARVEGLVAQKFMSPQAAEQTRLAEITAQAEVHAARSRVAVMQGEARALQSALTLAADQQHAQLVLRAPADGRILRIVDTSERVVSFGAPLLTLGDPRRIEIVADVLSQDAVRIRPGMAVEIRQWGGADTLIAHVHTVEPYAFTKVSALGVEEKRVNVIADIDHPPPALGDGYRVETAFIVWQAERVLKIPASALFRRGAQWAVFTLQGGRVNEQLVEVGARNPNEAQIIKGLRNGDRVVLHPDNSLQNGSRARATSSGEKDESTEK